MHPAQGGLLLSHSKTNQEANREKSDLKITKVPLRIHTIKTNSF